MCVVFVSIFFPAFLEYLMVSPGHSFILPSLFFFLFLLLFFLLFF